MRQRTRAGPHVVQVGEQEHLHELHQLDDAADDVLADAVEDPEAEAVLAEQPGHGRLQREPALAPLEIGDGLVQTFNRLRSRILEDAEGAT